MTRRDRPATEPSECRSCGALILWVQWPSGKRMPVDVGPVQDGDIVLTWRRTENVLLAARASQLDEEHRAGRNKYVSHFSSCPQADQHRKSNPNQPRNR